MTNNHNYAAKGKRVYSLTSDAECAEDLINFADSIHPGGLDSMDMGDAFGAFCAYLDREDYELTQKGEFMTSEQMLVGPGFTVTISADWEAFDWRESINDDF